MPQQKRVAAIHDISCFGKCSLTVALPIISAAGIETSVIPTAVLSTHTGGFTGFTYRDLTEDIMPIIDHWATENIGFDAVYTGFLGSFLQLDIISRIIDKYKSDGALIIVDPVMADNGSLYKIFGPDFPSGMRSICRKADLIIPNMTEALLLLDEPYREGPYKEKYIEIILKRLSALGPRKVTLTGVYFDSARLGAASYDAGTGCVDYAMADRIEGYYHGTGDVFASALTAAMLRGAELPAAARVAVEFTVAAITRTKNAGTDLRFGVNFEEGLSALSPAIESVIAK